VAFGESRPLVVSTNAGINGLYNNCPIVVLFVTFIHLRYSNNYAALKNGVVLLRVLLKKGHEIYNSRHICSSLDISLFATRT
jgi:hypothetical protein